MKTKSIKIVFAIVMVLLLSLVITVGVSAADTSEVTIEYRKSGDYNNAAQTVKTAADGSITLIGQFEHTEDGNFYGWFTEDGTLYEAGKEYVFTNDTVLYEAYGREVSTAGNIVEDLQKGLYVRLGTDVNWNGTFNICLENTNLVCALDLNGHNIKFTGGAGGSFGRIRSGGLMIVGNGTIDCTNQKNKDTAIFMFPNTDAAGKVTVGKNVTLKTNANFARFQGDRMTVQIKIYGALETREFFYKDGHLQNSTIEIFDGATLKINGQIMATKGNRNALQLTIYIYGGEITMPNANATTFNDRQGTDNAAMYAYSISGGTWNIIPPEEYLADNMSCVAYNEKYVVIRIGDCPAGGYHAIGEITDIVYANGFDNAGVTKYNCVKCGGGCDGTIEAIFTAIGYSVGEGSTSVYGGFSVDLTNLALYESLNGKIKFGLISGNASQDFVFEGGALTTEYAFMQEITERTFNKFGVTLSGFDPSAANYTGFKFVIAAYVIDENGSMTFMQKTDDAEDYYAGTVNFKVGENITELGTMTVSKVVSLSVSETPVALVPTKEEIL